MTPARLAECLETIGWSRLRLANRSGWSEGAVRQWLAGRTRVPDSIATTLEKLARCHQQNPFPARIITDD